MADVFSKKKRSQVMAAVKSKETKSTELKLISIYRANGIAGWRGLQFLEHSLKNPIQVEKRIKSVLSAAANGAKIWHQQ